MFRIPEPRAGFDLRAGASGRPSGIGRLNLAAVKDAVLRFEFGPTSLIIGLMAVCTLLIVLYLATYNSIATKGYDLKRLEADHSS